jgi:hypothetical protein
MRRTLAQWDAAIRAYETMVAALRRSDAGEGKVALGTVYSTATGVTMRCASSPRRHASIPPPDAQPQRRGVRAERQAAEAIEALRRHWLSTLATP